MTDNELTRLALLSGETESTKAFIAGYRLMEQRIKSARIEATVRSVYKTMDYKINVVDMKITHNDEVLIDKTVDTEKVQRGFQG